MRTATRPYNTSQSAAQEKKPDQNLRPKILTGNIKRFYLLRMWLGISFTVLFKYPNPKYIYKIIRKIADHKKKYTIGNSYSKLSYVDGRVYLSLNNNGWPGNHFYRSVDLEARIAINRKVNSFENLRMVLIAFTKKCPLYCEHCYEAPQLNKKETLSLADHKIILKKLQDANVPLIHFGGGDPMARIDELVELLHSAKKTSDFWIYTSGFNFTQKNALRLKMAGLTGVSISLDHHEPDKHNKFRRHNEAYKWVETAARNALRARLVITLSVCVTRDFCTSENLFTYLNLAKELGASFIQLIEPRPVGNYAGQDVTLKPEHEKILEYFLSEANCNSKYKSAPIVLYPAYYQRRTGCPGAGAKYLFIDTDGFISSCPFCRNTKSHILGDDHESAIEALRGDGCSKYSTLLQ